MGATPKAGTAAPPWPRMARGASLPEGSLGTGYAKMVAAEVVIARLGQHQLRLEATIS